MSRLNPLDQRVIKALPDSQERARTLHQIQLRAGLEHRKTMAVLGRLVSMGVAGVVYGFRLTRYYRKREVS